MPRIKEPLQITHDNISRPVAMSIARDVVKLLHLPDDTPVMMANEFDTLNQPNIPGISQVGQDAADFESRQRVRVVAKERPVHQYTLNENIRSNEEPPFFEDRALGVSLRPIYIRTEITLEFKYTAATRQQAIAWRDGFSADRGEERESIQHQVAYKIPLPEWFWDLMGHIHELREKTAGYGQSFPDYIDSITRCNMIPLGAVDHDQGKLILAIDESQVQVQGWFEFDEVPEETKVDGNSTWEVQFTYKAIYARPRHFYIVYPLMVHQSHIGKRWYKASPRFSVEEVRKNGPIGIRALDALDGNVDSLPPYMDGFRYPLHDEWIPGHNNVPPRTIPAATWMIKLSPKDPQDIISLRELPYVRLTKEVDDYFVAIHKTLHKTSGGSCVVTLYQNNVPMADSLITIDEHLNVRSTVPLDLRQAYHLRILFPVNYPTFAPAAIDQMATHHLATLQIFQSILPALDVEYALTILLDDDSLPYDYIKWFYRYLMIKGIGYPEGPGGGFPPWEVPGWNHDGNNVADGNGNGDNGLVRPGDEGRRAISHGRYIEYLAILTKKEP